MQELSRELLLYGSKIVHYVGGLDNINGVTSGKGMLLSISIIQMKYIDLKKMEHASFISEMIVGPTGITFLLDGVNAHELEMAIRLLEKEELEKINNDFQEEPVLDRFFTFFQRVFSPLLLVLLAVGILQAFIIIMISFRFASHLYSEESILTTISGAFYYFIPVMVAFSAAIYYKTNPYIAITVAGILLHPAVSDFTSKFIIGNMLQIHMFSEQFSSSMIPILFIVMFQANLDRKLEEKMPNTLLTIFKPFLLLVSSTIMGVFFFGPLMILIGNALIASFQILLRVVPWLATAIMGAFGSIFVMSGAHYSLFPLVKQSITTVGYETLLGPGMLMMYAAHAGVSLGVAVSLRQKLYQIYSGSAFLLALVGVSQPAFYGVEVFLKKPFIYAMIAGGTGGLFVGIMDVKVFGYVNAGMISLPYFTGKQGNLFSAVMGMMISFFIGFFLCWRVYRMEPADKDLETALTGTPKKSNRIS